MFVKTQEISSSRDFSIIREGNTWMQDVDQGH